ncbi:DUF6011 domain-containing protein [Streptosporangium canum]|uniref:DUF6011 domain-containing protein n=1 Tax=Streptosporangium canum TaxID=324952 RepID=UPI0036BC433F
MTTATATRTATPATDKQKIFFDNLLAEREHHLTPETIALIKAKASSTDMRGLIDELLKAPHKPMQSTNMPEPGIYKRDGQIYELKQNRHTGVLKVSRIEVFGTRVRRRATVLRARVFTTADKITLDDASGFGREYGICCCCFRLLTDPISVRDGIGPVCKAKYFPGL